MVGSWSQCTANDIAFFICRSLACGAGESRTKCTAESQTKCTAKGLELEPPGVTADNIEFLSS